jgi:hypothetical protein
VRHDRRVEAAGDFREISEIHKKVLS